MSQIIVANQAIALDTEGRVNLNALHSASGLGKTKQPSNWMRGESTKELIAELTANSSDLRSLPINTIEGRNGGTYAHELLAISYAGWISAKFQLQVNQAFLDSRSAPKPLNVGEQQVVISKDNYIELLESKIAHLQTASPKPNSGKAPKPLTQQEKQQILELHQQGVSFINIGKQLGRSRSAVRSVVREATLQLA